jgi:hypothetical protein
MGFEYKMGNFCEFGLWRKNARPLEANVSGVRIELSSDDISRVMADCIVCSANEQLRHE